MGKKVYLLLVMMMFVSSLFAQNPTRVERVKVDKKEINKRAANQREVLKNNRAVNPQYRDGGNTIVNTTILTEDFSNFTAGSIETPDATCLEDPETGEIADTYFNTPGWSGLEIYQAGGCAYIDFCDEINETGMLITPLMNTKGSLTIKCRMKSVNPEGDNVGYNIINEEYDVYDSNYGFLNADEWTDVEWFTSYGDENTYVYFFSYKDPVYIDDIEIIHHYMPVPTFLPETNITDTSFTANWTAIEDADEYQISMYANHTAPADETFYLADINFDNIETEATVDNPETPEEDGIYYDCWYFYLHMFAKGCLGVSGENADYYDYGYISSPEVDLSSDNGKATLSFKMKATEGDGIEIYLYTEQYGYYQEVYTEYITVENSNWNEYTIELANGYEKSIVEIWYYGADNAFFDDIKLSQNMTKGEVKTLMILEDYTAENYYDIVIDKKYRKDEIYYQLYGYKYIYAYNPYYDEYYISGRIVSDFTEPRYAPTNGLGVEDIEMLPASAYFTNGQLNVSNPENEMVSVYNISGVCVYNAVVNGAIDDNFAKGLYIVKVGNKVTKAINN